MRMNLDHEKLISISVLKPLGVYFLSTGSYETKNLTDDANRLSHRCSTMFATINTESSWPICLKTNP